MCMFLFVSLEISISQKNFAFWGRHEARRNTEGKDVIFSVPGSAITYRNQFHGKMTPIPDIQLLHCIYFRAVKNNLDLHPEELTWGRCAGAQDLSEKEMKEQSQEQ